MYGQYTTQEKQDAVWLSDVLSQVVDELGKYKYHVVRMMGDNASVITAAWERIKSKIPVRQACTCHSMNHCLQGTLEEHDTLRKMNAVHQPLEHEKVNLCTSCTLVALQLHASYTLTL